ncbi:hypothetical protein ACKLNR_010814 [Fusarium oxysporum f. sp. zingiberi]
MSDLLVKPYWRAIAHQSWTYGGSGQKFCLDPRLVTRDPSKVRKSKKGGPWIMAPNTDIATRAFVVSLKAPCSGKTSPEVAEISGLSIRQVDRIYARAIENGFDPNIRPLILKDEYLKDRPRSGRPTKVTEENKELLIGK